MAVKTFTTGEVLTASDTNTYLNNGGLVYVTSLVVPASPAAKTLTVTNCFSSTYDAYFVTWIGGVSAGAEALTLQLGPSSVSGYNTSYYQFVSYSSYGGTVTNLLTNNGAQFGYICEITGTVKTNCNFSLYGPNLAQYTGLVNGYIGGGGAGNGAGIHQSNGQFTGFTITGGANFNSGTVTVYGYRKA